MRSSTIRDRFARRKSICRYLVSLFDARTIALFVHTLSATVRASDRFTLLGCLAWSYQLSFCSRNAYQQDVCSLFTISIRSKLWFKSIWLIEEKRETTTYKKERERIKWETLPLMPSYIFLLEFRIWERDLLFDNVYFLMVDGDIILLYIMFLGTKMTT